MLEKILTNVSMIFRPNYWLMNNRFSKSWDTTLLHLMKRHRFKRNCEHTAWLGNVLIWTSNHPYSSFTPYENYKIGVRPRRSTIMLAQEKLEADLFGMYLKPEEQSP